MIWEALSYDSRTPLVFARGSMAAIRYIQEVLEYVTIPYIRRLENSIFQQDNAHPYVTVVTRKFEVQSQVPFLSCPSPLGSRTFTKGHVWNMISGKLKTLLHPLVTSDTLRHRMKFLKKKIYPHIRNLPSSVGDCIASRGESNFY